MQNIFDVSADKAPPDDYLRHNFVTDFVYELPLAKLNGSNTLLMRNLLHGWQFSGLFTARSGNPINVTQSTAFDGSRADYVGGTTVFTDYNRPCDT